MSCRNSYNVKFTLSIFIFMELHRSIEGAVSGMRGHNTNTITQLSNDEPQPEIYN